MVHNSLLVLWSLLSGSGVAAWSLKRDLHGGRRTNHRRLVTSLEAAPFTLPPQIASYLELPSDLMTDGLNGVRQGLQNLASPSFDVWKEEAMRSLNDVSNWREATTSSFPDIGALQLKLSIPDISLISASDLQEKLISLKAELEAFDDILVKQIIGAISDFQSALVLNYPQLDPLFLSAKDILTNVSPSFLLIGAAMVSVAILNASLNFGQTPPPVQPYPMNKYDAVAARAYFERRPLAVVSRAMTIALQSLRFGGSLLFDSLLNRVYDNELQRGRELAALLTCLGPTFIKVGQSLSIRTDLLRPAYIRGLETLQDQVPAFDTATARRILEAEWKKPLSEILVGDLPSQPVAAASLGQVYKARLRATNEEVAIKVQRPNIMEQIALDMYLIREVGDVLKRVFKLNTDTVGTVDAWGTGFVDELDYIQEAANGERFSEQILETPLRDVVFAPTVINDYTTRSVLVTAWVNGDRLDRSSSQDVSVLCSIAMNTYLTMLLEFGVLHCDPHPGNLLRTPEGKLCIMDWGMVTRLDTNLQLTLIEHMAHLTSADYAELPRDLLLLGFVPEDKANVIGDSGVVEVLSDIYGAWTSGGGAAAINVNQVIAQLQELTAQKGNLFRIPPYFAYIAKSFSVLEGIGLSNDKKYSIINECLPYVSKRLLTDKDKMGPALSTFIFGPEKANADRIVNYRRVEQLVEGFSEYTTSSSGALLGKENLTRSELLNDVAEQILDLVFTEEETPLQQIFLEQMAKIMSAGGRILLTQLRERSGLLPTGRTRLGTILDPLGVWRTSPLVRTNELDEKTVETTQKLVALMQRQIQNSGNPLFDLSTLTREESFELSSLLVRKVWAKRTGVLQTSNRFARTLLQLTADQLEKGERDTRRLPTRTSLQSSNSYVVRSQERTTSTSQRLEGARRLLDEIQKQPEVVFNEDAATATKHESPRLSRAREMLLGYQQGDSEEVIVPEVVA